MVPVVSLLLILGSSLVVTRIAAVALEHTGLGRDAARFQARSAFTGVGFTTTESESLVDHPVRRRIVMWLMLVGNVGIMSAMAALILSAIDLRTEQGVGSLLGVLVGGLVALWAMGSSQLVDRQMCRLIRWAITRFTALDAWDYARLLHVRDDYGVSRFRVDDDSWIAGLSLRDAALGSEGLLVLGIECPGGNFVGAPPADLEVRSGDELIVYGGAGRVEELGCRKVGDDGDRAHAEGANEHAQQLQSERLNAGR
jgi:hypothetical protein